MNIKNCARCGQDHADVKLLPLTVPVGPREGAVWVEFTATDATTREARYRLLRDKLNSDPRVDAVEWRELSWTHYALCPTNGQPIMVNYVNE